MVGMVRGTRVDKIKYYNPAALTKAIFDEWPMRFMCLSSFFFSFKTLFFLANFAFVSLDVLSGFVLPAFFCAILIQESRIMKGCTRRLTFEFVLAPLDKQS